ncbi:MAG: hypothetical protein PGN29_18390 [Gordonia paraffinivorans]
MNPSDQIEAIVARAVTTLRTVEQRHRAHRDAAAGDWQATPTGDEPEGDGPEARGDRETADAVGTRPVLGPAEIAALSDAAGG